MPQSLTFDEYNDIYEKADIIQKKILDKYYISFSGNKKIKSELLERFKENEQEIEGLSDIFVNSKYDNKWGTGQKRFIRTIFENCKNRNKNFFDDYLEPFFYNGLNHKRKNQYFSVFNCKIPFLNGGLFEPLDNYQWEVATFNIANEIFSNKEETGILDFFDRYNFTMNEEEPLEKDVAVDPEMLGKIFENLLDVKDRKSKGAFYTPREIVHYMCQESLANFLVNKVGVNYEEIKDFIQYGEMIRDEDLKGATKTVHLVGDTIFKNVVQIDKALGNIKIADPAVGSGAFPLGILNEIVKMRDILTSYVIIYNRLGIFDKQYEEEKIIQSRSIYNIKWNTIKNSIYAVDIENSAVDITKLRLWLSIVVDQVEVPKSGPEPLPNLDCKIMQGNSLIDEFNGIKLIDEKFVEDLKDRDNVVLNEGGKFKAKVGKTYKQIDIGNDQIQLGDGQKKAQIDGLIELKKELYGTNDPNRKKQLLQEIQAARNELLRLNFAGTNKEKEFFEIDSSHNKPYFAWMLEYIEVFIENDGFDIVIGNPPYGLINKKQNQQETIQMSEEQMKFIKSSKEYEAAKGGLLNIFRLFICKSHYILKENGNMCLIFPMAFMCDLSAAKLRRFIFENEQVKFIEAFPERDNENTRVFRSAKMSVCILESERKANSNEDFYIRQHWNKFVDSTNEKVVLNKEIVKKIDENNLTIPLISTRDLKIINKIISNSQKMEEYSKCYEGEVNLTFHKEFIFNTKNNYEKLIRGAQIQRYCVTDYVSQGEILYLDKDNYLKNVTSEKSQHYKYRRAIMQGITGVNEKHRLKLALIEHNEFCANSANYIIENNKLKIEYIIGILNSKLMNWFFKKLSTNSNVNGYEIDNLPIKISRENDLIENVVKYLEVKELNSNKESIESFENSIDKIVYDIYGLNEDDIKYIEGDEN
ncbi:MAG: Eco57I restriction-modification methylase domain-containing protein [Clostridia bacterium]|nr:Eco57I restriction-modification methylase domain-containing protein [Clostridia bacterium]